MARPAVRIQVVEFGVLVGLALLVGRAVQVQILHGRCWVEEAQAQRTERIVLQARRGALYDRHGTPLAVTQETYRAGREYESPARVIAPPVPGLDVVLTLDAELQEIAQRALDDALRRMDADGGDVVMLDPGTGDVLALASRQRDGSARPSAFTDTFEPGSLAKIFAAAALLSLRRVSLTDRVSGEGGKWRVLGRTITDDDPQPSLTMAHAIRVSSNIAIAKFAARLTPEEQYAMLRDFGFGALTGIEFPAEATGRLRPPSEWTRPSAASLAMGYELSVTPIQVAMAYGALANDGLLLEPT